MKTSSGERVLFDTNVLVYAANSSAPNHQAARELRDRAVAGEVAACVTPQVLLEYVAVVTSAKRVAVPVPACLRFSCRSPSPEQALPAIR